MVIHATSLFNVQCIWYGFVLGLSNDSEAAALCWLHYILTKFAFKKGKPINNKTVRFYGDGVNDELIALLQHFQYEIETTGSDNSVVIATTPPLVERMVLLSLENE